MKNKPTPKPKITAAAGSHKPTGEVFVYRVDPEPDTKAVYIINTPNFQMFRQYHIMSETHKTYISDNGDVTEIDTGAYNRMREKISGLSDEAALDLVRRAFRQGKIKKYSDPFKRKMYDHR